LLLYPAASEASPPALLLTPIEVPNAPEAEAIAPAASE
jgi:hypothetical protein